MLNNEVPTFNLNIYSYKYATTPPQMGLLFGVVFSCAIAHNNTN